MGASAPQRPNERKKRVFLEMSALIIGGWHKFKKDKLLSNVQRVVQQLESDVDVKAAFVPGLRRTHALLAIQCPRESEEEQGAVNPVQRKAARRKSVHRGQARIRPQKTLARIETSEFK